MVLLEALSDYLSPLRLKIILHSIFEHFGVSKWETSLVKCYNCTSGIQIYMQQVCSFFKPKTKALCSQGIRWLWDLINPEEEEGHRRFLEFQCRLNQEEHLALCNFTAEIICSLHENLSGKLNSSSSTLRDQLGRLHKCFPAGLKRVKLLVTNLKKSIKLE